MKKYKVKIAPEALGDIRDIKDWYNDARSGLGERFQNTTIKQINSLNQNSQLYAIRYNEIRCMIIKKFPFMVHFYINDDSNTVEVLAVISTDRNPKIWLEKVGKDID
ncbi:MAG: type II toxin-antitoxin system RelE/ParE family toxin [Mangrovibacterium sp.]